MCKLFGAGASAGEKTAQKTNASLALTLGQHYDTEFKSQDDMLKLLQGETAKIDSGETGLGFGPQEEAAREALIVNNAAAGERNAQQAEQNNAAGLGGSMGDGSGLARASGIRQMVAGESAISGENAKNNALLANKAANYNQGRAKAAQVAGLYGSLAGDYGGRANSSLSGEMNANNTSFEQSQIIAKEDQAASPWSFVGGLIQKGAGMALNYATGGMGGMMSSLGGAKAQSMGLQGNNPNFYSGQGANSFIQPTMYDPGNTLVGPS